MDLCLRRGTLVKIHIVQKGDTLWNIAKKYGVDFEELKKMNAQLSNPEMIMPGMKIKVPTTGGTIKKEVAIPKKETPKAVHPYKEQPVPTLPVQKEIIKEVPKKETIYTPIMPQPVIPEIDINNYYSMHMSQMQAQMQAPPPVKEEKVESIESPVEMPMMPVQEECFEVYPTVPCMPIADCGCGPTPYPYGYQAPMGHYPMQQGFPMGYNTPVMPEVQGAMSYAPENYYYGQGAYPTQVPEHGGWMHEEEESSSMPMMASHSMPQQGVFIQSQDAQFHGMHSMPNVQQGAYLPAPDGQYSGMPYNQYGQFGNMPQQGVNMNFPERPDNPHYGSHEYYGSQHDYHHHPDYHQGQGYGQGHEYGHAHHHHHGHHPYGHYGYHPYSHFYGVQQGWHPGYGNPYMGYGQGYPGYPGVSRWLPKTGRRL